MPKFRFYSLLLLTLLLKSCEVPDIHPFTQATSEMGTTIEAGLKQVAADLGKVQIPDAADTDPKERQQAVKKNQDSLKIYVARLNERVKAFNKVTLAFDAYAKALNGVVVRGKKTAKAIENVSSTLTSLLDAAAKFATLPGGKLPGATITLLKGFAQEATAAHTIHELGKLDSPRQDTLVQRTARALRLGLQDFGSIDTTAYVLRYNNRKDYDKGLEDLYQNSFNQQQAAIEPLRLISILRSYLLTPHLNLVSKRLSDLTKIDTITHNSPLIKKANEDWDKLPKNEKGLIDAKSKRTQQAVAKLDAALIARQDYYRGWLVPQGVSSLYEKEQAQYVAPDMKWLDKSQQAVMAWATAHHALRMALMKAKKVGPKDLLRYEQASQTFVEAVKGAKKIIFPHFISFWPMPTSLDSLETPADFQQELLARLKAAHAAFSQTNAGQRNAALLALQDFEKYPALPNDHLQQVAEDAINDLGLQNISDVLHGLSALENELQNAVQHELHTARFVAEEFRPRQHILRALSSLGALQSLQGKTFSSASRKKLDQAVKLVGNILPQPPVKGKTTVKTAKSGNSGSASSIKKPNP